MQSWPGLAAGDRRKKRHFVVIGDRCGEVAIDPVDSDAHRIQIFQRGFMPGRLFGDMRNQPANGINAVGKLQVFGCLPGMFFEPCKI